MGANSITSNPPASPLASHAASGSALVEVFSSGGGTQSACISALICQGKLPKPDIMVIADTGREMPTTWEYLDAVIRPAMAAIGVEVHRVLTRDWVSPADKHVFHTNGSLLIPAFSNMHGTPSKLSSFCSDKWKVRVITRWLKKVHGLGRSQCRKWIGFSLDETKRVLRMQEGHEYKAGLIRFPLVHDVPTRRQEAIQIVERMGWPTPPRSRCWMCPNQSDYEWREVKERPELWNAATSLDFSIRAGDPHAFLHSTLQPLSQADLTKPDDLFSGSCASGVCFL